MTLWKWIKGLFRRMPIHHCTACGAVVSAAEMEPVINGIDVNLYGSFCKNCYRDLKRVFDQ